MRGQIWSEVLLVAGGVVLGVFLVLGPLFQSLDSTLPARAGPKLTLAEVETEQNSFLPYTITYFGEDNGELYASAYPSTDDIANKLSSLGVAVKKK
jgi:hypothetical protein